MSRISANIATLREKVGLFVENFVHKDPIQGESSMLFRMLYDDKLAQAAYLIGCQHTGEAIIIDPERDVDRYIEAAAAESMKITAIAETHIHADFLSGARELAERTGARLYLSDEGDADWKYQWLDKKQTGGSYNHKLLKNGDTFKVGNIEIKAVHTPGHTPEHISFLVTNLGGGATEPMGIASGDFVFVGDVGRPDLLETAAGQVGAKEPSARVLYHSIQRFKDLPDYLQVWPAHGSGSACGKALGAVPQSTVGYEKRFNAAIAAATDEAHFVEAILDGQPEPPLYFARMKHDNKMGPAVLGKLPAPQAIDAAALKKLAAENAMILDTRPWQQFRDSHIPGALWAPLTNYFPNVAGSYVEPGTSIFLIVEENQVKDAVAALIRIGLDEVAGYATEATFAAYLAQGGQSLATRRMPIGNLKSENNSNGAFVLDVRGAAEYNAGHLAGATNVAYTRLMPRLHELPKDRTIYVHCRTDKRSAIAASFLQYNDFNVIHLEDGFEGWQQKGGVTVK
ncbi:MAG: rhodanese-like domain-containing protein [bacterium]